MFEGVQLVGNVLEDYPKLGGPNLRVHMLRTLDHASWIGVRRASE